MDESKRKTFEFLVERQRAYQLAFGSPAGAAVLADLVWFCRGNASCFHADPRIHAALEGRREAWLRIRQHLDMAPEELYEFYTKHPLMETDDG